MKSKMEKKVLSVPRIALSGQKGIRSSSLNRQSSLPSEFGVSGHLCANLGDWNGSKIAVSFKKQELSEWNVIGVGGNWKNYC